MLKFYSGMLSQDVIPLPQLTTSAKLRYLKKLLLNKHLQEAALVFTSGSQSHEEIESAGKKSVVYYFQGQHQLLSQFDTPQIAYLESNCSKILRQTESTTSNRVSFKVPLFPNIFPDKGRT